MRKAPVISEVLLQPSCRIYSLFVMMLAFLAKPRHYHTFISNPAANVLVFMLLCKFLTEATQRREGSGLVAQSNMLGKVCQSESVCVT